MEWTSHRKLHPPCIPNGLCNLLSLPSGATCPPSGAHLPHPGPWGGGGWAGDGRRAAVRHPGPAGRDAAQRPVRACHAGEAEGRRRRGRAPRRDAASVCFFQPLAVLEKAPGNCKITQFSILDQCSNINEAKSVAGNHWLRLSPSVNLLRGRVWSRLGIRCQQQQLVD